MAVPARPAERNGRDSLSELLRHALPVRDADSLLSDVSRAWRNATGAEAAFVSVRLSATGELRGSLSTGDSPPQQLVLPLPPSDEAWSPEAARQLLARHDGRASQPEIDSHTIPLTCDERCIGGVILLDNESSPARDSLSDEWTEISARLLAQAVACSTSHEQLERAKLRALAEFAAGAGHEINNPVAAISGRVQLLLKHETDAETRQALLTIGGQAHRIRDMIGDLMLFARPPAPEPEELDLCEAVHEVLDGLREVAEERSCRFDIDLPDRLPIRADRTQLGVVVSNLLHNSLNALENGGTVFVEARAQPDSDRRFAELAIADDGPGLSAKDREHLFDPFYAGRQAGRGLGFGLPKCWRIVSLHGGSIHVDSTPGGRTTFTVLWPAGESRTV